MSQREVRYTVSMPRPHTRLFHVEGRFEAQGLPHLDLVLPVWTPGSYLIREYARHLQDFTARDGDGAGRALPVERVDKRTFRVLTGGKVDRVQASWKVYANDLTVRASHLDDTHGFFNGATLFLHSEEDRSQPHRVSIDAPAGWQTHTALPLRGGDYLAADYDELVDSPFEIGPGSVSSFQAAGKTHRVVIWGKGNFEEKRLLGDLQKICEEEAQLFGGLPFDDYLFIILLNDKLRGGLEHKASTTLLCPRFGFKPQKAYEEFLTLAAHEYFHLWNVKRIKPRALVPFDYGRESYTALLWAMEGITSYYDNLLTRRTGLLEVERYLELVGENLSALAATPGRSVQSLADASRCAWIKYYRPDENSPNSSVSYYLKGELAALLLDLELRRRTADAKSLDDVMRLLWKRFGDGSGVPEDGVEKVASEVAGSSLGDFFDRAVHGTGELDLSAFGHVGLEVGYRTRESAADKGGTPPKDCKPGPEGKPRSTAWLGAVTRSAGERVIISQALADSPAQRDGLYADDELLAIDGFRVEPDKLQARLDDVGPGGSAELTLFRKDELKRVRVTLAEKPSDAAYLVRRAGASDEQRKAFEGWLKGPFEAAKAP